MAEYRIYCLDGEGHIALAEWFEATTDDDAIAQAREMKHDTIKCEVWQRDRLVASLKPVQHEQP